RTVELDQVDVYALYVKVHARGAQVLGGDTQACALTHRRLVVEAFAHGHAQAAAGDVQIDRLIKTAGVGGGVFIEHVAAGNAEIRGTVLHVGGHVGGAHDDDAQVGARGFQDQLARALGIVFYFDAGGLQQGNRF